jgi:hypothetical protein
VLLQSTWNVGWSPSSAVMVSGRGAGENDEPAAAVARTTEVADGGGGGTGAAAWSGAVAWAVGVTGGASRASGNQA